LVQNSVTYFMDGPLWSVAGVIWRDTMYTCTWCTRA